MSAELEEDFSLLEKNILKLKKDHSELSRRYAETEAELAAMREKYDEMRHRNQEMAEKQKEIKLQSAIAGNPEHNRLMKNHINRLIREVDSCIAQLQNIGL